MKNTFDSFTLWEDSQEDQSDLQNMVDFLEKMLFDLKGFKVARQVLIKRRFEMFLNSSDGEDEEGSGWGI